MTTGTANFASTAANQFLIHAAGGVGIGTSAPATTVHIKEGRDTNAYLRVESPVGREAGISLLSGGVGEVAMYSDNNADDLRFWVGGADAFRIEPASGTPNLIGGYSGNSVDAGAYGATIAGGGAPSSPNRVMLSYGTVSGGMNNVAGGSYDTVGGGYFNATSGSYSSIGGGIHNTAGLDYCTVAGGFYNAASGYSSTVGGGVDNTASDYYSTVGGGDENTAGDSYSTVGGGYDNSAGGTYSTIGGGSENAASGSRSTVGGGENNEGQRLI